MSILIASNLIALTFAKHTLVIILLLTNHQNTIITIPMHSLLLGGPPIVVDVGAQTSGARGSGVGGMRWGMEEDEVEGQHVGSICQVNSQSI